MRRVQLAAIGTDAAGTEDVVIGGHFLQLGDDPGAIERLELRRANGHRGFKVVQRAGVAAGLRHAGAASRGAGFQPFGEGAGAVVEVPVEALGQHQALRDFQAEGVNVRQEHQQATERRLDAEFLRLLDAVDGVRPGIGQADDLGAAGLGLQQIGGEIRGGGERRGDFAEHLAAAGFDEAGDVAGQRVAESVVGGDEEPAIAAGLDHGAAGGFAEHEGVIRPVDGLGVAERAAEVRGGAAGVDVGLVLFLGDGGDRERHGGTAAFHDDVNAVAVVPLARDGGADIGLVLMVGLDDFDIEAFIGHAEIRHRLAHAVHRDRADDVLIRPGQIGQHADFQAGALLRPRPE